MKCFFWPKELTPLPRCITSSITALTDQSNALKSHKFISPTSTSWTPSCVSADWNLCRAHYAQTVSVYYIILSTVHIPLVYAIFSFFFAIIRIPFHCRLVSGPTYLQIIKLWDSFVSHLGGQGMRSCSDFKQTSCSLFACLRLTSSWKAFELFSVGVPALKNCFKKCFKNSTSN